MGCADTALLKSSPRRTPTAFKENSFMDVRAAVAFEAGEEWIGVS